MQTCETRMRMGRRRPRGARRTGRRYTLCGCNNTILGVLPNVRKVPYDPVLFRQSTGKGKRSDQF